MKPKLTGARLSVLRAASMATLFLIVGHGPTIAQTAPPPGGTPTTPSKSLQTGTSCGGQGKAGAPTSEYACPNCNAPKEHEPQDPDPPPEGGGPRTPGNELMGGPTTGGPDAGGVATIGNGSVSIEEGGFRGGSGGGVGGGTGKGTRPEPT